MMHHTQKSHRQNRIGRWMAAGFLGLWVAAPALAESVTAEAIYQATGVRGGLVVHIGCGDGQLTASLGASSRYLVQGLSTDPEELAQARETIEAKGVYGRVTVRLFDGQRLPYVDQLVNLAVVSDPNKVPPAEIQRVLAPGGAAYVRAPDGWRTTVKPWPPDIDQWSHFLHDASGNAVAQDRQVGPPKGLRWTAGPRWCRSHEWPSSVMALVTAGGRLVGIIDEGPIGVYEGLPQKCRLVARDAFSGVLLWKVPLRDWQPQFGTGKSGRWGIHHTIPRRLVADADRVYVTLRFLDSPVSVLDAATGRVLIEALPGTTGADELILSNGVLFVKCTDQRSVAAMQRFGRDALHDSLVAVDTKTGKQLWRKDNIRIAPYALAALAGRVLYHDMDALVCLDARTGRQLWRSEWPLQWAFGGGITLVIHDGVVLFHARGQVPQPKAAEKPKEPAQSRNARKGRRRQPGNLYMTAFSLDDGRLLWQRPGHPSLAQACILPTDVFVTDGVVWYGQAFEGYDLHTGEVRRKVDVGNLISPGHHYRCHRAKAVARYLIWPKRGAEFIDVTDKNHMRHDWLRSPCFTGLLPANGLLYVPPSQCFCYPGVKVSGFLALSSRSAWEKASGAGEKSQPQPLQRGPASTTLDSQASAVDPTNDWPMYRHDNRRSGASRTAVPIELTQQWGARLVEPVPQAVVVGDRLWVVEKNVHRVRCLDAMSGKTLWTFTVEGRIDSPPTFYRGLILFGGRDGCVYCVRADDGRLLWRFRAAPDPRQVVSYEQLESIWPVHGSVLVQDDVVYFAAGRSSFLDGGLLVFGLEAQTGRLLFKNRLEGPWPNVKTEVGRPFAMEGALPDLFVSDGSSLYMGRIKFDAKLNRIPLEWGSSLGELDMGVDHLVATGGFLDDTGFDRLFWMYSRWWPGFYFAQHAPKSGQLVVFDESTTYAVKYFYRRTMWSPAFYPQTRGYLLFADDNDNEPALEDKQGTVKAIRWLPEESYTDKYRAGGRGVEKGTGWVRTRPTKWQELIPLRIRAMVLAGPYLFVAGVPDQVPPEDPLAPFEGRVPGKLQVFSAADGKLLRSYDLPASPVFDGLSAAHGRLYLSLKDGQLLCFSRTGE